MENSKAGPHEAKSTTTVTSTEQDPSNNNNINSSAIPTVLVEGGAGESNAAVVVNENDDRQRRTPFSNLSQVDADLALARTLQEQERAYMMIRMNGDGSDYGSWETGSYVAEDDHDFDDHSEDDEDSDVADDDADDNDHEHDHDDDDEEEEEDAFDVHAHAEHGDDDDNIGVELDPAQFPNDEAYARALQDAEDREMAARLLALSGISEMVVGESEEAEDHDGHSQVIQDTWDEVDPDELSYEELLALGDVVGTESRGLSADRIASLPSISYKMQSNKDGNNDSCVICRLDFEDDDTLTVLSCKHSYHSECISNWLRINKACPVCSAEVSTSGNS